MLQKVTKKHKRSSRWSKNGIRVSPARTVDVQYFEKKHGRWRYREEEMTEDKFVLRFAREPKEFYKGARIY